MAKDQEIFVLSEEALVRLWLTDQLAANKLTKQQADEFWRNYLRSETRYLATYFTTAGDVATLTKLARDLRTPLGRVFFKHYGGKLHVVFKGRAGLRQILTGTKYSVSNAKVISLGIGKAGVKSAVRQGAFVSIILLTVWDIADYVMNDEATLGQLIGTIASDVAKVAVSGVVAAAVGAAAVGTVIGTFALGPLIVAVAVGIGVSIVLDKLDNDYRWTAKLQKLLDDAIATANNAVAQSKQNVLDWTSEQAGKVIEGLFILGRDAVIDYARRRLNDMFRRQPLPWM